MGKLFGAAEKLRIAIQDISDLKAQQAASDAVLTSLMTFLLSRIPGAKAELAALRSTFVVHAHAAKVDDAQSDDDARRDVEITKLKTEQFIQDTIDRIEKRLAALD